MQWILRHSPYVEYEDQEKVVVKCHDCTRHVIFPRGGGEVPEFVDKGDQDASHSFSTVPWFDVGLKKRK